MYTSYYNLTESPFSIAPDPRYLYMSEHHREALAHLLYGVRCDGGFVLLTGEIGAGKTTLCRSLLGQLPDDVDVAFVLNPKLSVIELLETICDELRIPRTGSLTVKSLVDALNARLLETHAAGRKTVLIIDEAQNLSLEVLEQLRLLTNLETDRRKLLQIVLLGQPELRGMLARPELMQLAQRVTARYHLGALSADELTGYVVHRLTVAGCDQPVFSQAAIRRIWRETRGVPRLINLVCDRALLGAYVRELPEVNVGVVRQAAREVLVDLSGLPRHRPATGLWFGLAMGAAVLALGAWTWWTQPQVTELPHEAKASVASVVAVSDTTVADTPEEPLAKTWPEDFAHGRKRDAAYADLAGLWGADLTSDKDEFCSLALQSGLRCLPRRGSLDELRKLDRPAALRLYDDAGQPFDVVLAGLEGRTARFIAGDEMHELDLAVLETLWFGDYMMLWSAVPELTEMLKPGSTGTGVGWLAGSLERLGRYHPTGLEQSLSGELLGALKRFQMTSGLTPDGVLGPMTLIHLNNALQSSGPRLQRMEAS